MTTSQQDLAVCAASVVADAYLAWCRAERIPPPPSEADEEDTAPDDEWSAAVAAAKATGPGGVGARGRAGRLAPPPAELVLPGALAASPAFQQQQQQQHQSAGAVSASPLAAAATAAALAPAPDSPRAVSVPAARSLLLPALRSTRALERFRNELSLRAAADAFYGSVVDMLEDRQALWRVAAGGALVRWWLPLDRRGELDALTGLRRQMRCV